MSCIFGLLWCEASSSVRLLGIYVKTNPFKAFLYQLAGSAWFHMLSNLHIRLQFATQLQNSVHLMLFVTESWLAWDSVSFCLTHENVSVLTVTGVKHMCSSQECNSLTTEEVPGYHLCSVCSLWNNPCGTRLNTGNLESVWWVICSSSGTRERLSSPTV